MNSILKNRIENEQKNADKATFFLMHNNFTLLNFVVTKKKKYRRYYCTNATKHIPTHTTIP